MTDLSLTRPGLRSGYAAQRTRSPSSFAAALAFNGGVFALILALPATQYVMQKQGGLVVVPISVDKDPPPIEKPRERKDPVPTQKTIEDTVVETKPFVTQPVVKFPVDDVITTTRELGTVEKVIDPPLPPVHKPVFQGAMRDPRFADAFHPPYPPALQREGREGSVTVRVTIDEKGRVIACDLVKATDKAFFEETRDQALKRWRFRPATSDGVPVQSQQTLTVDFKLEA